VVDGVDVGQGMMSLVATQKLGVHETRRYKYYKQEMSKERSRVIMAGGLDIMKGFVKREAVLCNAICVSGILAAILTKKSPTKGPGGLYKTNKNK
jgi:uncharacterized protein YbbK (DUF523 family)